jgi:hypothetical protein
MKLPNIVVMLMDNLGHGDLGCTGSPHHRTPHIDRLAGEGIRFTSFYSTSGVCTPSRVSLMTGCYPRRVNLDVSGKGLAVLMPAERPDVVARLLALSDKAREDLGDEGREGRNQRPAGWVEHPTPRLLREENA